MPNLAIKITFFRADNRKRKQTPSLFNFRNGSSKQTREERQQNKQRHQFERREKGGEREAQQSRLGDQLEHAEQQQQQHRRRLGKNWRRRKVNLCINISLIGSFRSKRGETRVKIHFIGKSGSINLATRLRSFLETLLFF